MKPRRHACGCSCTCADLNLRPAGADGSEGGACFGGGLAAATSKRFKHEKTLVMLNPLLSGEGFIGCPSELAAVGTVTAVACYLCAITC